MDRGLRAKQFAPFLSLNGFEEAVRAKRSKPTPRRILSEEESEKLSEAISRLSRGQLLRLDFYNGRGYEALAGRVENIDFTMKHLSLCGRCIYFEDIFSVTAKGR